MASAVITKDEFNRFWDTVLGRDWYIDETDIPDQWWEAPDDNTPITVRDLALGWQGLSTHVPEPTEWITARDLRDGGPNFFTLLKRWRGQQSTVTVAVEVPRDREQEFLAAVAGIGARICGGQ